LTDFLVSSILQGNDETDAFTTPTARPQNAKMFVADEWASLNKPEIKRTKW